MYVPRINWKPGPVELPPTRARRLGWVMAACGVFLILMMAALIGYFVWVLWNSNNPNATDRFTGGPFVGALIFALFAAVFAFGVAALTSGIWQIRHGRRHPNAARWGAMAFVGLSVAAVIFESVSLFENLF